jgi:hypothetical protein
MKKLDTLALLASLSVMSGSDGKHISVVDNETEYKLDDKEWYCADCECEYQGRPNRCRCGGHHLKRKALE